MKNQLIIATIALTFSLAVSADGSGHEHAPVDHSKMDHSKMDHSKMDHSKMTMPQMQAMKKAMDAEMIKIINTVDLNQRKTLYVAHKKSMKAMQEAMMKQCTAK